MKRELKYPVYKLDALPEMAYDYFVYKNEFSGQKMKAYTGTIISRSSSNSMGIMKHYCFFYGVDANNVAWVIHNDQYGVECISFIDYLDGFTDYNIDPVTNNSYKAEIISRAIERKNKMFHMKENNCEHFVNYSVYGKNISYQSQFTKWAQNLILWGMEIGVVMSGSEKLMTRYKEFKRIVNKPARIKITPRNKQVFK